MCADVYAYLYVCVLQVQGVLLKTFCKAAVLLARNGPQKIITATTCHCSILTSTPYAGELAPSIILFLYLLKAVSEEEVMTLVG